MSLKQILIIILCVLMLLTIVLASVVFRRIVSPTPTTPTPSSPSRPAPTESEATTAPTEFVPPVTTGPTEPGHTHNFATLIRKVETTCTVSGYDIYLCECGQSAALNQQAAPGHDYQEANQDATCTVDGYAGTKCTRCGDVQKTAVLPAPGHDHQTPVHQDATCTVDGYDGLQCTRCSNVKKTEIYTAPGHDWGEWLPNPEDSTKENHTCTVCATTESRDVITEPDPSEPGTEPSEPGTDPSEPGEPEPSEPGGSSDPTESVQ
ncbi:MAG: hypothetical protein E7439_06825 [Ruminococcaceae bacterium]|nr:hypothetical protein [Oscillospiraceae bacterium]